MEDGSLGDDINPWGVAMFATLREVELGSPNRERPTASDLIRPRPARKPARPGSTARPASCRRRCGRPVPAVAVLLVFMLGFADRAQRAPIQGSFMGNVVAIIVTMLLLLNFLDEPVP